MALKTWLSSGSARSVTTSCCSIRTTGRSCSGGVNARRTLTRPRSPQRAYIDR
ncbi:hypothetical protein ACQ86F_33310 [Streptomyces venezuelae ATCC 10712]